MARKPVQKPVLRVVEADDTPDRHDVVENESLDEAIASSDPMRILLAQRRSMVASLPSLKGAPLAAMHRQIMIATEKIEALKAQAHGEPTPGVEAEDDTFDPNDV